MTTDYRAPLYNSYVGGHQGILPEKRNQARLAEDVLRHLPQGRTATILDVGCGQGMLVRFLANHGYEEVLGVDLSEEQIRLARELGSTNVAQADLFEVANRRPNDFDVLVALDVVEHFDRVDVQRVFDAFYRLLKPGGILVLRTPNGVSPYSGRYQFSDLTHGVIYTDRSLAQVAAVTGFINVRVFPVRPAGSASFSAEDVCCGRSSKRSSSSRSWSRQANSAAMSSRKTSCVRQQGPSNDERSHDSRTFGESRSRRGRQRRQGGRTCRTLSGFDHERTPVPAMTGAVVQALLWLLPWSIRRRLLQIIFGYQIDPSARIGYSLVMPKQLQMASGSVIRHLNVIRGMDLLSMGPGAGISRANWIYATPSGAPVYAHEPHRRPELILEEGAGITNRHLIDCSATVRIGKYSMVVGAGTQVLTHAITIRDNRATTAPVSIGQFCMVATRAVIMMGASLPSYSVLAPGSVLRHAPRTTHTVYSGVPAVPAAQLPEDAEFFRADKHVSHQRAKFGRGGS